MFKTIYRCLKYLVIDIWDLIVICLSTERSPYGCYLVLRLLVLMFVIIS